MKSVASMPIILGAGVIAEIVAILLVGGLSPWLRGGLTPSLSV